MSASFIGQEVDGRGLACDEHRVSKIVIEHVRADMVDAFLRIQEEWRRIAIDFADAHDE